MSIRVGSITCDCGKWHCTAGIGAATECTCGRLLQPQIFDLLHVGLSGSGTPTDPGTSVPAAGPTA